MYIYLLRCSYYLGSCPCGLEKKEIGIKTMRGIRWSYQKYITKKQRFGRCPDCKKAVVLTGENHYFAPVGSESFWEQFGYRLLRD